MSKQIYIDSDGNEIQVSGTVNSADMLPVEAGSTKMTSEAIGDLSELTTTRQDSLVDAVNEVVTKLGGKISQVKFENTPVSISATSGYFEFASVLNYPTANSILIGCDVRTASLYATSGTVIQCCYAPNGAKPAFQYQRGGSAFSNVNYDFVFTFYEP